jgi:hypothetical protein
MVPISRDVVISFSPFESSCSSLHLIRTTFMHVMNTANSHLFRERLASAEREFGGINDHSTPRSLPTLPESQRQKPIAAGIYNKKADSPPSL